MRYFVQHFIIGFGFLSGVWIKIGFDPEDFFIEFFGTLMNYWFPNNILMPWFWVLPIVLLAVAIIGTFFFGGLVGFLALGLALFAGILVPSVLSAVLLGSAVVAGIYAIKLKTG